MSWRTGHVGSEAPSPRAGCVRWAVVLVVTGCVLGCWGALRAAPSPADQDFLAQVVADTEHLAATGRLVGSPGHGQAVGWLLEEARSLEGVRTWTHDFEVVVPWTERAELEIRDADGSEQVHRVYPFWPASARLNTTPEGGVAGRLVYVGQARPQDLPANALRGQIAVVEMAARDRWREAWNLGADAIIVLGSSEETYLDAAAHTLHISAHFPRFYVPAGELADRLRRETGLSGRLEVNCSWRVQTATTILALVTPQEPVGEQRAVLVGAAMDGMSIVPDLAYGADRAVDTALLLNLLRSLSANRPARPILVAFIDGYSFNQRGVRELMGALSLTEADTAVWDRQDTRTTQRYQRHEHLARDLEERDDPMRALGARPFAPLHAYVKDEVAREVVAIETVMHPMRLERFSLSGPEYDKMSRRIDELAQRRADFFAAQQFLLEGADVPDLIRGLAETLWRQARRRIAVQLEQLEAVADHRAAGHRLRREIVEALGLGDEVDRPVEFFLGVDLSDAAPAAGVMTWCSLVLQGDLRNSQALRYWLRELIRQDESPWPDDLDSALNLASLVGLDAASSHTVGPVAALTSAAGFLGMPASTWGTLGAPRHRADTPADRAEALNWTRLGPQVHATQRLAESLANAPDFVARTGQSPHWDHVEGYIVDRSPGDPAPRLPMEGYLTVLVNGHTRGGRARVEEVPIVPGIRRQEMAFTGIDGRFRFPYLPVSSQWRLRRFYVQAHDFARDGRIVRALDLARAARGLRLELQIGARDGRGLRAMAFSCREIAQTGFYDPRFLVPLRDGDLLDAVGGAEPQRRNLTLQQGMLAAFVEPGMRWTVILRAGITRNRMALLNMDTHGDDLRRAMRGFGPDAPLHRHPAHQSALDLYHLDGWRLEQYRQAGITSEPIEQLQQRSADLLEEAERALHDDDGAGLIRSAGAALANEVRAYQAVRDTANDVVRGAIFLLLMLVPFSYAMERLLICTPHVYRQILATGGIFAVMTVVLWAFHPAFDISGQPMMIIMAFAIIAMSAMVISMIYSKFESGLEEMRSGRAEASAARTSRAGVLATAVRLGIANMRKRRLRTVLTGIAVVLITFSLLCFISTSSYRGRRAWGLDHAAPWTGVLIHQPGQRPMDEPARRFVELLVEPHRVAARYWWVNPHHHNWRVHVRAMYSGRQASVQAALGVSHMEAALTGLDRLCAQWDRFAEGRGCYLSASTAYELGVTPGDRVFVAGHELELLGVFEPGPMDDLAIDLDGRSILPMDFDAMGGEQRQLAHRADAEVLASQEAALGMVEEMDFPSLSSDRVVIVPTDVLRELDGVRLQSLAIPMDDADRAAALAESLTEVLAMPVYYGRDGRVRVLVSTPMLPTAPRGLLIPLLIGGLMIFNTMLSAITERRREVYIYTSIGLAPWHVAVLFLAEAATYGLMGSVFGYIVGQGVATVLSAQGWMGGLTLNYSGTQAMSVMMMVLGVVVLSSLVPAYLAGRMAVPSNEMRWKLPEPDGDRLRDALPFIVTDRMAPGVIRFLYEYVDAHREGAIGHFSSDHVRMTRPSDDGAIALDATIWLAPYDLGVRQHVRLTVEPTSEDDVWLLEVELTRQAGQQRSWLSLNRTFLGDLRRQLLGWRRLKSGRLLEYIALGRAALENDEALQPSPDALG